MGRRWVRCDNLALATVSFSRMIETGSYRFVIILTGTIIYICIYKLHTHAKKTQKNVHKYCDILGFLGNATMKTIVSP
jgi:hypothetical protein